MNFSNMSSTTAAPPAAPSPEKFKPTHPFIVVVPSKVASELKLKESLTLAKILLAFRLKKVNYDLVTLNECKCESVI